MSTDKFDFIYLGQVFIFAKTRNIVNYECGFVQNRHVTHFSNRIIQAWIAQKASARAKVLIAFETRICR